MALRVILGILALVGGSVGFVMFTTATREMVCEYSRLFPCGHLSRRVNMLVVLMFACMLTCAWSLGFVGK